MGPNGLRAAVSTVVHDPRWNPKNVAEDLTDLVFLPQTVNQLGQEMAQTNRTMAMTNRELKGLAGAINTTNHGIKKMDGDLDRMGRLGPRHM
jgi:hypothetical protein